jgi:hypothetical protein
MRDIKKGDKNMSMITREPITAEALKATIEELMDFHGIERRGAQLVKKYTAEVTSWNCKTLMELDARLKAEAKIILENYKED